MASVSELDLQQHAGRPDLQALVPRRPQRRQTRGPTLPRSVVHSHWRLPLHTSAKCRERRLALYLPTPQRTAGLLRQRAQVTGPRLAPRSEAAPTVPPPVTRRFRNGLRPPTPHAAGAQLAADLVAKPDVRRLRARRSDLGGCATQKPALPARAIAQYQAPVSCGGRRQGT